MEHRIRVKDDKGKDIYILAITSDTPAEDLQFEIETSGYRRSMILCKKCYKIIDSKSAFCNHCGEKVN